MGFLGAARIEKNKAAALCAAIFIVSAMSGCEESVEPRAEVLVPVEVSLIQPGNIKNEMTYAGQLSAAESVNVMSRVTAKVVEIRFDVGDAVNKGDVLCKLDERDIQDQLKALTAQIEQAKQGIAQAENAVASVTGGQYQAQILQQETNLDSYDKQLENAKLMIQNAEIAIAQTENAVESAEKGLNVAKSAYETTAAQFENTRVLYEAGLVAQNDFDRAKLGLDQAEAQVNQAEAGLKQAQSAREQAKKGLEQALLSYDTLVMAKESAGQGLDLTTGVVVSDNERAALLALESAKAGYNVLLTQQELLENTLTDTEIKSPISGVISYRSAKENEYVSSQLPPFVVMDLSKVYVDVRVSELIINSIKPGDTVDVTLNALGDTVKGTVKTVSPAADQTGTFPVKIEIANDDLILKPGMFAEVRFIKEESAGTVVLPRNTVLSDENGFFVYIESDGRAVKTPVVTGIDNGREIEIISGLDVGSRVIVKGHDYVNNNERVNVVAELGG